MKNTLAIITLLALSIIAAPAASVTTFAGTGTKGFSGDGGLATKAELNNVFGIARGPDGFLYICDMDNARVRRVGPDGKIETYAGDGVRGQIGRAHV